MEFVRSVAKKRPEVNPVFSDETLYWRRFKNPIVIKETANISALTFSPVRPHDLAACTSFKVQLYQAGSFSLKREITRTKETIHAAHFRDDGKLLLIGDSTGLLQVHDPHSRSILRSLREHTGAIRSVQFGPSRTEAISCSDDSLVKLWDIPSEKSKFTYKDHQDSVRQVSFDSTSALFLSASYDSTVKLWDPRASSASLLTLDHGAPVESAIFLKNSSIIVSAGANYIRVWDILAGGKLMSSVSHHLKLITCIHYDAARNRILTGSLDKTVKILSAETFELDYGINYAAPVLSLALSPDHECLAVGMASGLLDIKLRTSEIDHETEKLKLSKSSSTASKKEIYPNSKEFFLRRGTSTDLPTETLRIAPKHKKLATHDKYLKRFQYKKALDHVVEKGTIIAIIGVMEEIRSRNAFEACFSHRTEQAILPFARFMLKHITNPNYSHLICAFCEIILDMNAKLLGQSSDFDEVFLKLSTRLHVELSLQRDIYGLLGAISLITANSSK